MSNPIDQAQAREQLDRDLALRAHAERMSRPGRCDCIDCGRAIDPRRRAAMPSAVRCIGCALVDEAKGRRST